MPELLTGLTLDNIPGPHRSQPVYALGEGLKTAQAVFVMIHGRGATAESLLSLSGEIRAPGLAFIAPQASGYTWYPYSFLEPLESNQPHLDSALAAVDSLITQLEDLGKPTQQIFLLGFSQGACLAVEYVRRHPRRYGGLFGLSGGLIGPPGTKFEAAGSLEGTPVFLGCSDQDPHIPAWRVQESGQVFELMQAEVTQRLYPGLGHTVNLDEIKVINTITNQSLA